MSHLEAEVTNHHVLIQDLMDKVKVLEARKTPSGLILPSGVLPGPGAATVSRAEFERVRGALVNEIEGLKAELAVVADVAFEAVRILDRMCGMGA